MIFRASRGNRGRDRFLEIKALLLVTGASIGIAGMISERSWLVTIAIIVVAAGMVLRLIERRKDE